jgi:hypothetical protein
MHVLNSLTYPFHTVWMYISICIYIYIYLYLSLYISQNIQYTINMYNFYLLVKINLKQIKF